MTVAFYLKRPGTEKERPATATAIYCRISYQGNQLKYYIPEQISPRNWNFQAKKAKETKQFKESPEFNSRLDNIRSTIKTVYRTYLNDHASKPPAPGVLKELLDAAIRQKTEAGRLSFMDYFKDFIERSKAGIRLNPKTGKPLSPNTLKVYRTTLSHIERYQATTKKTVDFDTIDLDFYGAYSEYLTKKATLKKKIDKNTSSGCPQMPLVKISRS
jgi:hypothetical protein